MSRTVPTTLGSPNARFLDTSERRQLAMRLIDLATEAIMRLVSMPRRPLKFNAGAPINGCFAVPFAFVIEGVFAAGSAHRHTLQGTI